MNINEKVAEKLAACGPAIAERVIAHMAEKEIARRSEAVLKGFDEILKLEREVRRIKPDITTYNEDGTIADATYSKSLIDVRNAQTARFAKMNSALDKALDRNDFADLFNLVNVKPNDKPDQKADSTGG